MSEWHWEWPMRIDCDKCAEKDRRIKELKTDWQKTIDLLNTERKQSDKTVTMLNSRIEALQDALAAVEALNPILDLETEGEFQDAIHWFQRGQISGWNRCIASVQAALQEKSDE